MPNHLVLGTALIAISATAGAQSTQTTIVRAPITAIAIGPSNASVDVNVNNGNGSHTVIVRKPLIAVSVPWYSMHIRVN